MVRFVLKAIEKLRVEVEDQGAAGSACGCLEAGSRPAEYTLPDREEREDLEGDASSKRDRGCAE